MSKRTEEVATETWVLTDSDTDHYVAKVVFDKLSGGLLLTRRVAVVSTMGDIQRQLSSGPQADRTESVRLNAGEVLQLIDLLKVLLAEPSR